MSGAQHLSSSSGRELAPEKHRSQEGRDHKSFASGHPRANRQKPSGIAAKELILRVHLIPFLGAKKVSAIENEDVQRLKGRLAEKAPKTVNNVLTVLSTLLKKAVEWGVIDQMPCTIRLLKVSKPAVSFYDFDEYERLVDAAKAID